MHTSTQSPVLCHMVLCNERNESPTFLFHFFIALSYERISLISVQSSTDCIYQQELLLFAKASSGLTKRKPRGLSNACGYSKPDEKHPWKQQATWRAGFARTTSFRIWSNHWRKKTMSCHQLIQPFCPAFPPQPFTKRFAFHDRLPTRKPIAHVQYM